MLAENGTSELRKRGKTKPRSVPGGLGLGLSQTQVLCSQLPGCVVGLESVVASR